MQQAIKETLVSFKVAKLAKKKGFDEVCSYLYENSKDMVYTTHKNSGLNKHFDWYSAPTQDLLRTWLLEIHSIHITIFSKSQESWMYRITTKGQSLENGLYGEDFYSYEEALDEGLYHALNLLPDVNI